MTPSRGSLRLLQVTSFVSTVDRFAMPPMLVAMAAALDVPLASIVHAASLYFLAYGLMQPVWGVVSDRLGRVRTLRLSLLLAGLATAASAAAPGLTAVTITRVLAGAAFAAAIPAGLIYVGDTVPGPRRQREIANLMTGVALGTALASTGAGALAQTVTWRVTFAISAVFALTLVVLLRKLPEPDTGRVTEPLLAPAGRVLRSGSTLVLLLLVFVEGAVLLGALTLLPAAIEDAGASPALAGAVTAVYGVAVFLVAKLVGRWSRTWPPSRLILAGAAAVAAACGLATFSRAAAVATGVAILIGFGWAAMHSTLQTWATQILPSARATVVSLFAGCLFAGSAASAAALAGPVDDGRFGLVFGIFTAITVPLGIAAAYARARWREPVQALDRSDR